MKTLRQGNVHINFFVYFCSAILHNAGVLENPL